MEETRRSNRSSETRRSNRSSKSSTRRIKSPNSISPRRSSNSQESVESEKRPALLSSLSNRVEFDESIIFSGKEIIPEGSVSLFCNTHGEVGLNVEKYNYKFINPAFFSPYLKLHRFIKTSKGSVSFSNINEDNNVYKRLMYKNNIFSTKLFTNLKYSDFEKRIKSKKINIAENIFKKHYSNLYKPIDFDKSMKINNDILINKLSFSNPEDPEDDKKRIENKYKKFKQKYNKKYNVNRIINKIFYIETRLSIENKKHLKEAIDESLYNINNVIAFRNDVTILYPFPIDAPINDYVIDQLNKIKIFKFKYLNVNTYFNNIYYKIGIPEFKEEDENGKKYNITYKKGTNLLSCPYFISYLVEAMDYEVNDIFPNLIFSNSFDPVPSGEKLDYYLHLCREYPQLLIEIGPNKLTKTDYYPYFKNGIILTVSKTLRTLMVEKLNLQSLLVYLQVNTYNSVYMIDYSCDFISVKSEKIKLFNTIEQRIKLLKEKDVGDLTNKEKDEIRRFEYMISILEDQTIRGGN
jgi:hypothetical protein